MSDASIKSTMNARLPASPMLLQGSAQAGANLSLAATAWMVSGITASPLLNTLLPALGALPFLLHLKRTARGYWLQIVGVLILLGVSLALKPMGEHKTLLLLGSFAAVLLFQIGQEISALPLQRQLIDEAGNSMKRLRSSQEIGSLIGNLLAAVSDAALVERMTPLGDEPMRWQVLVRSGAVGGLVGSIGLGLICQVLNLVVALPLVSAGFITLAITQSRHATPT